MLGRNGLISAFVLSLSFTFVGCMGASSPDVTAENDSRHQDDWLRDSPFARSSKAQQEIVRILYDLLGEERAKKKNWNPKNANAAICRLTPYSDKDLFDTFDRIVKSWKRDRKFYFQSKLNCQSTWIVLPLLYRLPAEPIRQNPQMFIHGESWPWKKDDCPFVWSGGWPFWVAAGEADANGSPFCIQHLSTKYVDLYRAYGVRRAVQEPTESVLREADAVIASEPWKRSFAYRQKRPDNAAPAMLYATLEQALRAHASPAMANLSIRKLRTQFRQNSSNQSEVQYVMTKWKHHLEAETTPTKSQGEPHNSIQP